MKDTFLAYLEDKLSREERQKFEETLKHSPALQEELERYRVLLELETQLAGENRELGPDFTVRVMEAIESQSVFERFLLSDVVQRYFEMSRKYIAPTAGFALVVLCVLVAREVSDRGISLQEIPSESAVKSKEAREELPANEREPLGDPLAGEIEQYSDLVVSDKDRQEVKAGGTQGQKNVTTGVEVSRAIPENKRELHSSQSVVKDSEIRVNDLYADRREAPKPQNPEKAMPQPPTPSIRVNGLIASRGEASRTGNLNEAKLQADLIRSPTRDQTSAETKPNLDKSFQYRDSSAVPSQSDVSVNSEVLPSSLGANSQEARKPQKVVRPPSPPRTRSIVSEREIASDSMYPTARYNRGEGYGSYEESPRQSVTDQPVSTFSLDVDTGSYTNARRFLRMGQLPPADAVRVEEFVNYFDYNYPKPQEKPFGVHYEIAPSPFSQGRHIIQLGLSARDIDQDRQTPWNLVFLVDVSGSMAQANKLPLVQSSLKYLVSRMRSQDRIAIVTYANSATLALDSVSIDKKTEIIRAIDSLSAGGGTNGSGGIQMAYELAAKHAIDGGVNRVILATDGDFNVGISDFDGLMSLIERKRKEGTTLTTLGFGVGNYQEKNLEQLANRGNGNYFYLDSFEEANRIFGSRLVSTMQVVARDAKVQVEFNPSNVLEYRLIGYDNRRLRNRDFNDDAIDAGDIGAGHTVTALYEVVLADSKLAEKLDSPLRYSQPKKVKKPQASEFLNEIALVKLRYKLPGKNESTLAKFPLEKAAVVSAFERASTDFRFVSAVAGFGLILRNSQYIDSFTLAKVEKILAGIEKGSVDEKSDELRSLVSMAKALKQ